MYRIFVSYSHSDLQWAEYLKRLLTDVGVAVFVAEHDLPAGESLSAAIAKRIRQSDLFVLLWSRNSQRSTYVQKEIFLAKNEEKRFLPVALDSAVELPRELGDIKYLDVTKNPASQLAWLKKYVESSATSKATSNAIALAFVALLGYRLFTGK